MPRQEIIRKIGQLFRLRTDINLSSSILDTPELFQQGISSADTAMLPLYQTTRDYMEITQRVELLNKKLEVISDLMEMLNEHVSKRHGESLEWVVIWLVFACVIIAFFEIYLNVQKFLYLSEWGGLGVDLIRFDLMLACFLELWMRIDILSVEIIYRHSSLFIILLNDWGRYTAATIEEHTHPIVHTKRNQDDFPWAEPDAWSVDWPP